MIVISIILLSASTVCALRINSAPAYDPKDCEGHMVGGHCQNENGGAWSYRNEDGKCAQSETTVPHDPLMVEMLATEFPEVKSVIDFGGGPGAYLTSFRDHLKLTDLVTIEPHPLGECLFHGLKQDTTNVIQTPIEELKQKFSNVDLAMTLEVAEHIPVQYHSHLIDFLTAIASKWVVFSAAHPGQDGEGHIGPSMKTATQ